MPILYSFRRCPYAIRARLALYLSKISHGHREIDLKNKPIEMLTMSPKGTVPILIVSNDILLEESLDIMKWAFKIPNLDSKDTLLIEENDTRFKYALDRYKYPGRYPVKDDLDYQKECIEFLRKIENRLSPFLNGNNISFLDLAIFPFIRQFSMVDSEWFKELPYPHVKMWLSSLTESELFQNVMKKYPLWTLNNDPIIISSY
ncbi:MAG: hypothetical protein BGO77_05135 [Caedibacter sp. 37-49]|nr:MAG: hypothetical protein BGO77_05135 [Caedibacter sp. 37-49]